MERIGSISLMEEKIFEWRDGGIANKKKEKRFLTPEEVDLLAEILTLKGIQSVEIANYKKEIAEAKERYQELYDSYPYGCLTLDDGAKIIEANQAAAQILGVEKSRLQNLLFMQFLSDEYLEDFRKYYISIIQTVTRQNAELVMKTSNGERFEVELSGVPIMNKQKSSYSCRLVFTRRNDSKGLHPSEMKEAGDKTRDYIRQRLYSILVAEGKPSA